MGELTDGERVRVDELRLRPCRKGHDRADAFIGRKTSGKPVLYCRECHRQRCAKQRRQAATAPDAAGE